MMLYAEKNDGVIYSDIVLDTPDGMKINRYNDFDSTKVVTTMQYPGSSILVPKKIADAVLEYQGGFDKEIPGMEDWDMQICTHHLGFCAYHIPEPLFVYRLSTSTKREADYAKIDQIVAYMDKKWSAYRKGEKQIMCGCRQQKPSANLPASLLSSSGNFTKESIEKAVETNSTNLMVVLEYIGPDQNTFSIRSRVSRDVTYRFGNNDGHRTRAIYVGDAQFLLGMTDQSGQPLYRVVSSVAAVESSDPAAFLGQPITA